jgi:hypothetical protein
VDQVPSQVKPSSHAASSSADVQVAPGRRLALLLRPSQGCVPPDGVVMFDGPLVRFLRSSTMVESLPSIRNCTLFRFWSLLRQAMVWVLTANAWSVRVSVVDAVFVIYGCQLCELNFSLILTCSVSRLVSVKKSEERTVDVALGTEV